MNLEILQNQDRMKSLDPSGMYEAIFDFPEQMEKADRIGQSIKPEDIKGQNLKAVILAGMGGSAIGADIIRSCFGSELKIPFEICRHYRLPAFVDNSCLVVISSYSGNTEETVAAFEDALTRRANIICLTTGGKIADLAARYKCPLIKLPEGLQPRAALGYSFVPLMYLLMKAGLLAAKDDIVKLIVEGLKKYRLQFGREIPLATNPAKSLALHLFHKIPLIYTGPELTDAVGLRWKQQFCENSKVPSFNNHFAEFNHNELVGLESGPAPLLENFGIVILRDSDDHPRIARRMSLVRDMMEKKGISAVNVYSQGDFPLGRAFSLIQLGDFASYYLAMLQEVDPTPVTAINYLKAALSKQ